MARRYTRDNRGRFASAGGGGATARGGRLRTASGKKRATQTMKAAGGGGDGVIRGRTARTVAGQKVMGKLAKRPEQANAAPKATATAKGARLGGEGAKMAASTKQAAYRSASAKASAARKEASKFNYKNEPYNPKNFFGGSAVRAANMAKASPETLAEFKALQNASSAFSRGRSKTAKASTEASNKAFGLRKAANASRPGTMLAARSAAKPAPKPRPAKPAAKPAQAKAAPKEVPSQKPGTVPLNQVRRYNALDRARYKQKQKYSREISVVTGAVGPGALQRIDKSFKEAKLASRKTSRIEATMRRISNSPNSPNVPVLPRAKQLGEMITGRRNLYRRMTPRITASPIAGTIKRPAPKPPTPPPPTGSRTKTQAKAAQRNRREQVLDRARTGVTGLGSMRKNPRIRKVQTGMSQLSLMGRAKPLVKFKPAKKR